MMELEKMRQSQADLIAKMQGSFAEEQTKIASEHAKTAEALLKLSERSDKQASRFNTLFTIIAVVALVLALGEIAYPNGISGIRFPYARQESPTLSPPPTVGTPTSPP